MATAVRLTVLTGPHKGGRFCFCGPNQCEIGRALDCFVQLAGADQDQLISRHHCRLDIDPPAVQVQDLGSLNGTYLNGRALGPGQNEYSEEAGFSVQDGDLINVAGTTLRVDIVDCPPAKKVSGAAPVWQVGETARKDCPLRC
jgi:pSer/pThr/pTyr-binding forkhead associated (FHA) protein